MRTEILDVVSQHAKVNQVTDLPCYANFVTQFFEGNSYWLDKVRRSPAANSEPSLKLMAFTGLLVAQFGLPLLSGQLRRHTWKSWKRSEFSDPHQAALAIYMAKLNVQSYPIKEDWINRLSDPSLAPGVWGTQMAVKEGQIIGSHQPDEVVFRARIEDDTRAICLPDEPVNRRLATIAFDGEVAERIPLEEYERDVFPEVQAATGGLL